MSKTIEKVFKKRFNGIMQFVVDYQDFLLAPAGSCLFISGKGKEEFFAYLESTEIDSELNCQRLFLQYEIISQVGINSVKKTIVGEYYLPLEGKINLEYFSKNLHKEYKVE